MLYFSNPLLFKPKKYYLIFYKPINYKNSLLYCNVLFLKMMLDFDPFWISAPSFTLSVAAVAALL